MASRSSGMWVALDSRVFAPGGSSTDGKVEPRRLRLAQSASTIAVVTSGISGGDKVIIEGSQRVHRGQVVSPERASPA